MASSTPLEVRLALAWLSCKLFVASWMEDIGRTCLDSSLPPVPRPAQTQAYTTRRLQHAGHEYDAPGVFATNPREAPGTVAWREAIPVGHTDLTQEEVHSVVQQMGQQYKGNRCVRIG